MLPALFAPLLARLIGGLLAASVCNTHRVVAASRTAASAFAHNLRNS
jgi:hypothetical protein